MVLIMAGNEFFYPEIPVDNISTEQGLQDPILSISQAQVLRQLDESILSQDEIGILKAYQSIALSEIAPRKVRIEVARARQRLVIYQVLKKAIERNDEQTICNWYNETTPIGSMHFSLEEQKKIAEAITRQRSLENFRQAVSQNQFELAYEIYLNADLASSNLFLTQDGFLLDSLILERKKRQSSQVDIKLPISFSQLSDAQMAQLWLDGQINLASLTDNLQHSNLEKTIIKVGYIARIERALQAKDRKQLIWLLKSSKESRYMPDGELRARIESFLGLDDLRVCLPGL